jgi:hypothetical protein
MIRQKSVTGLDQVMETGFPKRSCSNETIDHDPIQSDRIILGTAGVKIGPQRDKGAVVRENAPPSILSRR